MGIEVQVPKNKEQRFWGIIDPNQNREVVMNLQVLKIMKLK